MVSKCKLCFSKYEKLLRAVCYIGIAICIIIGILLFFVDNILGGAIVISSCLISSFLVSGFFTQKVKTWFGNKDKKRVIYVAFYALIMLICMLTTIIVCLSMTYSAEELAPPSIEYAESAIKMDKANISIVETEIYEYFTVGDSYYFAMETTYELTETGGVVTLHYPITYVRANKYNGNLSIINFVQYENAKTYIKQIKGVRTKRTPFILLNFA